MLLSLAVERYTVILKPFVHLTRAMMLWKRCFGICFGIWILAGVLSMPGHSTTTRKKIRWIRIPKIQPLFGLTLLTQLTHLFTSVVFGHVLPCTVMIFSYTRVIYHDWFNNEANTTTNTALLQPRSKLRKLFILVAITFIVTRTPIFVIQILTQLVRNGNSWKLKLFYVTYSAQRRKVTLGIGEGYLTARKKCTMFESVCVVQTHSNRTKNKNVHDSHV